MSSRKRIKKVDDEDLHKFDEDDITSSGDELSDTEKKLLDKVRKKRVPDNFDSEDEVYGLDNDDDDDGDDDDEDDGNDVEYASEESDIGLRDDDDMPDERAWGKNKRAYYNTDYVDPDYATSNQKDMEAAEAEEREAIKIQQRLAEQLDDADFGFELIQGLADERKEGNECEEIIELDLSRMSKNQKLELLEKESPEFEPLLTDFKTHLAEIRYIIIPFLNLIKKLDIEDCPALNYIRTRYHLQLNYCVNVSFYLMLKAKQISITTHPVIKRLAQYRQLLNQFDEEQGHLLTGISQILEAHQNGQPIYKTADNMEIQSKKVIKRKSVNDKDDSNSKKKHKKTVQVTDDLHEDDIVYDDDDDDSNDDSDALENDSDVNKEDKNEKLDSLNVPSDQKRPITYEIAKNKGLTPYRKKELRNPRVKHRLKYRKAQIRRKGAVREVRKEVKKYSGEFSGIKASVKKGIKLK